MESISFEELSNQSQIVDNNLNVEDLENQRVDSPLLDFILNENEHDDFYHEVVKIRDSIQIAKMATSEDQGPSGDPTVLDIQILYSQLQRFGERVRVYKSEVNNQRLHPGVNWDKYKELQENLLKKRMWDIIDSSELCKYMRVKALAQTLNTAADMRKSLCTQLLCQDLPEGWSYDTLAQIISNIERSWTYIQQAVLLTPDQLKYLESIKPVYLTNLEFDENEDLLSKAMDQAMLFDESKVLENSSAIDTVKTESVVEDMNIDEPHDTLNSIVNKTEDSHVHQDDDWDDASTDLSPKIDSKVEQKTRESTDMPISPKIPLTSPKVSKKQLRKQRRKLKLLERKKLIQEKTKEKGLTVRSQSVISHKQIAPKISSQEIHDQKMDVDVSPPIFEADHVKDAMTLSKIRNMEKNAFVALGLHRPMRLTPSSCPKPNKHKCTITNPKDLQDTKDTHALYLSLTMFNNKQAIIITTMKNGSNSCVLIYIRKVITKVQTVEDKLVLYQFPSSVKLHQVQMLARKINKKPLHLGIFRLNGPNSCVKLSVENHKFNISQ